MLPIRKQDKVVLDKRQVVLLFFLIPLFFYNLLIKLVLSCEKFFMCLFFENLQNFMLFYLLEGMLHVNVENVR